MPRILIVEEDGASSPIVLAMELDDPNYEIETVHSADEALQWLRKQTLRSSASNVFMIDQDGTEFFRTHKIASCQGALVMRAENQQRQSAQCEFDLSNTDTPVKPFARLELPGQIGAFGKNPKAAHVLMLGNLRLDSIERRVYRGGSEIELMPKELALLELLMRNPKHTFSPQALLERLWKGERLTSEETVRTHVKTLRQKLGDQDGKIVVTRRGFGYCIGDRLDGDHETTGDSHLRGSTDIPGASASE